MRDRTAEWMEMKAQVDSFLAGHLATQRAYRLCKRVLKDWEEEIALVRQRHQCRVGIDRCARELRSASRRKIQTTLARLVPGLELASGTDTPRGFLKLARRVLEAAEAAAQSGKTAPEGLTQGELEQFRGMVTLLEASQETILLGGAELRKAAEELEECRKGQDDVLAKLDWVVPLVFPGQEDMVQEWHAARRMKTACGGPMPVFPEPAVSNHYDPGNERRLRDMARRSHPRRAPTPSPAQAAGLHTCL